MLFQFFSKKAPGCLSAGLGICLSFGYNGRNLSI